MDLSQLKGYKTYIMIVATICYALGGAVAGFVDYSVAIGLILGVLGLGGLRDAITNPIKVEEPKTPTPAPGYP